MLQPVRYEATAELLLANPRDAGVFREIGPRNIDANRYVRNQAQRLQSSTVAARTAEQLEGRLTTEEIRERITATASSDADLIAVAASGQTPEGAAALANAVVDAYQNVVAADMRDFADRSIAELEEAQGELQARIDEAQQVLAASPDNAFAEQERDAAVSQLIANQQLIERIAVDAALYGSGVEMVEPALPPDAPVAPRTLANTLLAALLGLGGAGAVAVWRGRVLQRADHRHDPADVVQVPLLGAVPDLGEVSGATEQCPTVTAPDSPAAEAYRFVATALEHTLAKDVRTIVVTSAQAGEGKTTVAVNLAVALTQAERPALLVDTDVRRRGLSKLTSSTELPGLADLGGYTVDDAVHQWTQGPAEFLRALPGVVPVGTRDLDPTQYFRTMRYRAALQLLQERDELLVIDSPPLLAVSDASAIAGSADAIVLVVNRGTPLHVLSALQERLAFVGTPVLGYVFNRVTGRERDYYGYAQPIGGPPRPDVWGVKPPAERPPDAPGGFADSSWSRPGDARDVRSAFERR